APTEAGELCSHPRVVLRQQVAPTTVAHLGRSRRRVDDVSEHHRQQAPRELPATAGACQKLLNLLDDRVAVADERQRVHSLQLDMTRAGYVLGQIERATRVPSRLTGPMHDKRRHLHATQYVTLVELSRCAQQDTSLAWARRETLQAREPGRQRG